MFSGHGICRDPPGQRGCWFPSLGECRSPPLSWACVLGLKSHRDPPPLPPNHLVQIWGCRWLILSDTLARVAPRLSILSFLLKRRHLLCPKSRLSRSLDGSGGVTGIHSAPTCPALAPHQAPRHRLNTTQGLSAALEAGAVLARVTRLGHETMINEQLILTLSSRGWRRACTARCPGTAHVLTLDKTPARGPTYFPATLSAPHTLGHC